MSLDKVDRRGEAVLVNALGPDSFRGDASIAYGRPGHIPGSINVPTSSLVDPATGQYFDQKTIEEIFAKAGVKQDDAIIAYCGAGVAASNVVFARLLTGAHSACRGVRRIAARMVGRSQAPAGGRKLICVILRDATFRPLLRMGNEIPVSSPAENPRSSSLSQPTVSSSLLRASSSARTPVSAAAPSRKCNGGWSISAILRMACAARAGSPSCLPWRLEKNARVLPAVSA